MKEFIVEKKDKGQRLDKYLQKILPSASKSFLYKMLRKKNIVLNDHKAEGMEILNIEDSIKIYFSDETFLKFSTKSADDSLFCKAFDEIKGVQVVFENKDIIFVNKPVGIPCQTDDHNKISLNEWIIGYLINKGQADDTQKAAVANRLDTNTSGLVLAGKSYLGLRYASDVIKSHELRKFYLAICHGKVTDNIDLKAYLYKDSATNKVTITNDSTLGDYIETVVKPLEYNNGYTLLEIELITGKPHQIRAHLSSIGHPLAGDIKYGGKAYGSYKHQMLHAYKVILPVNDELNIDESNRTIISYPEKSFLNGFETLLT